MENNQTFNKYKVKLTWEAVLKSVMSGLSLGLSACGLISLICWLVGYKDGVWVALGVGLGLVVFSFPFFFFFLYRPSLLQTGRRVDSMGLQERAVTMLQYQNDDSFMATRQRSDAVLHIASASSSATIRKAFPLQIPLHNILSLVVTFVVSVPICIVGGLFNLGIIQSPLAPADPFEKFVAVSYIVDGDQGGEIIGETDQLLSPGEDATTVTAVATDSYVFVGWSDGVQNPTRTDLKITEDMEMAAIFEMLDGDGEGGDGDPNMPGNEGDQATDKPGDEAGQANGGDGDGSGDNGDGEGSGSGDENKGEGKGDGQGDGAGGQWNEGNKIINGEIFYRDYLDQYHADAMQELTALDDLPPEIREFIEAYYESV